MYEEHDQDLRLLNSKIVMYLCRHQNLDRNRPLFMSHCGKMERVFVKFVSPEKCEPWHRSNFQY